VVPATAGGTGETPVVPAGQILAELLNAEFELPVVPAFHRWYRRWPVVLAQG